MQISVARELGADGYGIFGVVLSALMVLSSFVPFGWLEGAPKFVAEYRERNQPALLLGVIARSQQVSLLGALVCSGLLAVGTLLFSFDSSTTMVLLGTAMLLPAYTLSRLQQQILLTVQRVVEGLVFVHVLVPLTVLAGLQLIPSPTVDLVLWLYLLGTMLACLAQGVGIVLRLPRRLAREYRTREWHAITFSLMAGMMGQRLLNQGDVMLLAPFVGVSEVGVYALARRLVDVVVFANQALASALAPMLGSALVGGRLAQARRLLRLGSLWSTMWAMPFVLVGFLFPTSILRCFGQSFLGGELILQITVLGALANAASGPVGLALLIGGHEQFWRRSALVTTLAGIAGYLVATPLWGELGMAVVRTLYLIGLNLWRFVYLSEAVVGPDRPAETPS